MPETTEPLTNSTSEREQRLREIRERWSVKASNTKSWGEHPTLQSVGGISGAMADIDFLLSLLDSEAANPTGWITAKVCFDNAAAQICSPVSAGGDEDQCAWTLDDSNDGDFWETGCGEAFRFTDGGPTDNGFTFCYKCGKRIDAGKYSDSVGEEGK